MRRGPGGVGAINRQRLAKEKYATKGTEIADIQLSQMGKQLESFKTSLEDFAGKYKQEIRKNPEFRGHFQQMCARIGVDPLASSKGFWAELLGVGDFYYELGVQIIEICMATRPRNGGIMALNDLHKKVMKTSKSRQGVTEDDLARAIKKLHVMGSGFQGSGFTSVATLTKDLGWERDRAMQVLDHMVHEEMAWVDDQAPNERLYWFPGLFPET
ncbi:vacuolar-sorting protein SNF8-like isoform X2 [Montipora foliosa]|uniref:vacuolar-sorting protein SNF8-like isoform X2 n=1 Tax=Montipora foliosa TaxID=591990 RepID=UPI0035F21176